MLAVSGKLQTHHGSPLYFYGFSLRWNQYQSYLQPTTDGSGMIVHMDFTNSLKSTALQIIRLSEQLSGRTHTWNQENSAPAQGYTDRAGFVVYDDIELFADVYVASEDATEGKLRTRLAWSPKEVDQDSFTIITLDFKSDVAQTKRLVDISDNLKQQDIITLLNDDKTTPYLIHVSLESNTNSDGKSSGKRYEYSAKELENITEDNKTDFIKTLSEAYDFIVAKISQQ